VECIESRESMVELAVSPNLRTIGPKYKENAAEVSRMLEQVDGDELAKHLRSKGRVRLGGFDLSEEDVVVSEKQKRGFAHAASGDVHVYISLEVDKRLRIEGLAREVIRRIQHMRKQQGLQFEDQVDVMYSAHPDIELAISSYRPHICNETHARKVERAVSSESATRWTVDKMPLELTVKRAGP